MVGGDGGLGPRSEAALAAPGGTAVTPPPPLFVGRGRGEEPKHLDLGVADSAQKLR